MSNWTHATIPDQDRTQREADRIERERGCQPFEFSLTPQERDIAVNAKLEVLAQFGRRTTGLTVIELTPADQSEKEQVSYVAAGGVL